MTQLFNFLSANPWVFKYIAMGCGFGAVIVLWDLFFGIHWIRDVIIPVIVIGFFVLIYIGA